MEQSGLPQKLYFYVNMNVQKKKRKMCEINIFVKTQQSQPLCIIFG